MTNSSRRKQDKLNKLSTGRHFRVVGDKVKKYEAELPVCEIEDVVAAVEEHEDMSAPLVGTQDTRGIFLGTWELKDKDGNQLSKIFNVFAAPENIFNERKNTLSYDGIVRLLSGEKDFHGYAGAGYRSDTEIYEALRNGSYNGEWFIPPRELLVGTVGNGPEGVRQGAASQPDNLFDYKEKGALSGTFAKESMNGDDHYGWYWSSTSPVEHPEWRHHVNFSDGYESCATTDTRGMRCRLVRLELKHG
jgi:hypothetical protein